MFKLINSIVQNFAKFLAFTLGSVLTILIWIIGKVDTFFMVGIALVVWVLYKSAIVITKLFSLILWAPEKLAVASFLFALDISREEHKEQMALLEDEQKMLLQSMEATAAKRADSADDQIDEKVKNDPS